MASHNFAMFGGHWSDASEGITSLVFRVTSEDHLSEGSHDFMGGSSSLYVTTLPSVIAVDIVVVEISFWFCVIRDLVRLSACHAYIHEIYNNQNTDGNIKWVQWNKSDPDQTLRFLGNEWWNILKPLIKLFASHFLKYRRKGKREKQKLTLSATNWHITSIGTCIFWTLRSFSIVLKGGINFNRF